MTISNLYVFGDRQPQHPDYRPAYYTCLYWMGSGDRDHLERAAERETAAGRQAFIHDGLTAGRDALPVNPSPELQAALTRAGWTEARYVTEEDREYDRGKGIQVA